MNNIKIIKVAEKIQETPKIATLKFNETLDAKPGQFLMVWIPGVSEKPFSLSYLPKIGITVMDVGPFSHKLFKLGVGDKIGIRGPCGRGFEIKNEIKNILVVGGGVGIAPIAPLLVDENNKDKNFTVIIGALCGDEVLFEKRLNKNSNLIKK